MKTTGKTWKEIQKEAMEISGLSLTCTCMCHLGALGLCYVYNYHSLHRISLAFVNPDVYLDIHVHVRNVFSKYAKMETELTIFRDFYN